MTELIARILDRPGPPTVQRVELTLAAAHRRARMGDYRSAAEHVQRALDMCRPLQASRVLADCLLNAARVIDADDPMSRIREAEAIAEQLGDRALADATYRARGQIARLAGRYDEAIGCYEHVILTVKEPDHRLNAHYSLAAIHEEQGRWQDARDQLLVAEQCAGETGAWRVASDACVRLAQVELAVHDPDRARRAYERAAIWCAPSADYPAQLFEFDAVGALVRAEAGDLATAAAIAQQHVLRADLGDQASACHGWLITGEILARATDLIGTRRCMSRLLRHLFGAVLYIRANGLEAMAGTLDAPSQRDDADRLAAAGAAMRARHDLVAPPWLTVANRAREHIAARPAPDTPPMTDDDAVALAHEPI